MQMHVLREPPVMNEHLVPAALKGFVSACVTSIEDAGNLIKWWGLGANYCPQKPVLLLYPGFKEVALIACEGVTPAAELQDLAQSTFGRALEKQTKNGGKLFDSDVMREKFGAVPLAERDAAMRNAFDDYVAIKKKSIRTYEREMEDRNNAST